MYLIQILCVKFEIVISEFILSGINLEDLEISQYKNIYSLYTNSYYFL